MNKFVYFPSYDTHAVNRRPVQIVTIYTSSLLLSLRSLPCMYLW